MSGFFTAFSTVFFGCYGNFFYPPRKKSVTKGSSPTCLERWPWRLGSKSTWGGGVSAE